MQEKFLMHYNYLIFYIETLDSIKKFHNIQYLGNF